MSRGIHVAIANTRCRYLESGSHASDGEIPLFPFGNAGRGGVSETDTKLCIAAKTLGSHHIYSTEGGH